MLVNPLVLSRLSVLRLSEFSVPLLPECLDEFTFRLNEGRVKIHTLDRIDSLLEKSVGTRITYKQLVVPKGSKIHCSLFYADDRGSVSAHAEFSGFPPGILFCAPSTELRTGAHDGAESALRGSITRDDLSRRQNSSRRDHQNRGPQRQIFVAGVERAATLYEIKQDPVSLGMPKRVRIFW